MYTDLLSSRRMASAREALAYERRLLDRTTVVAHRGERIRTMYAVLTNSAHVIGRANVDALGHEYIPNYRPGSVQGPTH